MPGGNASGISARHNAHLLLAAADKASREIWFHGVEYIMIHLLLFVNDAMRAKIPPFSRREVGGNFCFWSAVPKPLDQVEVIGLG